MPAYADPYADPAGAPPPPSNMPAPGGPPPGPGGMDPADQAMQSIEAQREEMMQVYLAARPDPEEEGYKVKTLELLQKEIQGFMDSLAKAGAGEMGELAWEADPATVQNGKVAGPVPDALWVPLMVIADAVGSVAGGEYADKHKFSIEGAAKDNGVKILAGEVAKAGKDKGLVKALSEGPQPTEEQQAAESEAMATNEDEIVSAAMG